MLPQWVQTCALDQIVGKLLDGLDRRGIDHVVEHTSDRGGIDTVDAARPVGLSRGKLDGHFLDAHCLDIDGEATATCGSQR